MGARFRSVARRWFPKRYCSRGLARAEQRAREELKAAKGLSAAERHDLRRKLEEDIWEWREWLCEIEDKELVAKALKMDVYLDEIPVPSPVDGMDKSHYTLGTFGNELLRLESKEALIKKVREKSPAYRKERREILELYSKAGAVMIGIIGAATGLFAVLNK